MLQAPCRPGCTWHTVHVHTAAARLCLRYNPMQDVCVRIAHAGVEAASSTAPELLNASSLGPDAFAHEKSSQAKRLAAMWDEAARQVRGGAATPFATRYTFVWAYRTGLQS